jgi:hypothetical protein
MARNLKFKPDVPNGRVLVLDGDRPIGYGGVRFKLVGERE